MTINNKLFLVRDKEPLGIKKILIVDDEKNITDVLATILISLGYSVSTASDGEEALSILKKEYYELVITDIKMPQMDGLSLLKEINKLKKDIIIIMLTGLATTDTAVEAMRSGAFDYVVKPFNIEKIIDVVARADKEFIEKCD
ncbi:MAG: sigma-54-dependent Fis family transcriptional regulator, partial [Nitrospirae bacterium]|nr:sigma-54-dependent Fis family transcriptional regulator [Nitrospirota bacterium]